MYKTGMMTLLAYAWRLSGHDIKNQSENMCFPCDILNTINFSVEHGNNRNAAIEILIRMPHGCNN